MAREDSVALAVLDSGVAGYFAGAERRKCLPVRVPLEVRAVDFARLLELARKRITIELEKKR